MKKRIKAVAGVLALAVAFSGGVIAGRENISITAPITASAYETYGAFEYKIKYDKEIEITDFDDVLARELIIPSEIEGLPVTSIGDYAFAGSINEYFSFESIIIPDSVTSIGNRVFAGTSFSSIDIPYSVTSMGEEAFASCYAESINVSENNLYYSSENGVLFNKDKTKLITYPYNKNETEYVIPDSVISIGDYAFHECLKSIVIPDSVTSIGVSAFFECGFESIELPDSVKSIGDGAFYRCSSLKSIVIPNSVTSIGGEVFGCCTNLESIVIPDSVTSIGDGIFRNCLSLSSIDISENNQYYLVENGVLFNKNKTELIQYLEEKKETEYIIPDTVKRIGDFAFSNAKLTTIEIPESVTYIGDCAFWGCKNLTTIYGYENSTAQAYAEEHGYNFEPIDTATEIQKGDINGDGKVNAVDASVILTYYAYLSTTEDENVMDIDEFQATYQE